MEKILKINWEGKKIKAIKGGILFVNGEQNRFDFVPKDPMQVEVPITGNSVEITIKLITTFRDNEIIRFSRTITLGDEDGVYSCNINVSDRGIFHVQISKPNKEVSAKDPIYYHSNSEKNYELLCEMGNCFCFPIYGFYKGFTNIRNRTFDLGAACVGFFFSIIFSMMAASNHAVVSLGLGHAKLISYEPFSFTDWIINLLAGGILTLMGLLRLIFELIF